MDYKDEMRKLIDIVKQQSFTAPLEQTLDDMKTIANAVKDMSDRIDLRVRKSLQSTFLDIYGFGMMRYFGWA
jgi:hypothetical protein